MKGEQTEKKNNEKTSACYGSGVHVDEDDNVRLGVVVLLDNSR